MNNVTCTKCGLADSAAGPECKRCGTPYGPAAAGGFAPSPLFRQAPQGGAAYYEPSGKVTLKGLALGLGGGLVAAVVLAFAYAYLNNYIPIIQLNVLCLVGYAAALGVTAAALVRWGKMRNPTVGIFIAVLIACASYYLSWAVWLPLIVSGNGLGSSWWELASDPARMWDVLLLVNEKGAWSMGHLGSSRNNPTVSGVLLWVFWAAEALTVLIGTAVMAWKGLTSAPFCEPCRTWCKEEKGLVSIRAAEPDELKRRFEAKDFQYMKAVGPWQAGDSEWCRLDLHRCPVCDKTNTLSLKREKLKVDRKGNQDVASKEVFRGLLLSEADVRQLRQVGSELKRQQPAAV
jgi:hypothetical protein